MSLNSVPDGIDRQILQAAASGSPLGLTPTSAWRGIGRILTIPAIAHRLQRLVQHGLLDEGHCLDRRVFRLTPAGRAALDKSARADLGGSA